MQQKTRPNTRKTPKKSNFMRQFARHLCAKTRPIREFFAKKANFFAPALAIFIFLLLSCFRLDRAIWFDEAYSAYLVRGNFSQIWQMTSIDVHPPFYYFCLKIWSLLFGDSALALRTLSVLFGVLALIFAYILAKRLFGTKKATIATLALSISPIFIRYAQEMRMYTLVFAIVLAASVVLHAGLTVSQAAKKEPKKSDKKRQALLWASYAALLALGMWTHYFAALAWLAHLVFIVIYFKKHGFDRAVFWAYSLAVALYLPWLPTAIKHFLSVEGGFWIPAVSWRTPLDYLAESSFYSQVSESALAVILALALIIFAGFVAVKCLKKLKKAEKQNFLLLALLVFLPPLLLILLSLPPMTPKFVLRYVLYSAALLWFFFGLVFAFSLEQRRKVLAPILAILMLVASGFGVNNVIADSNDTSIPTFLAALERDKHRAPTLVNLSGYLEFFFYEGSQPMLAVEPNIQWGSLQPIVEYGQNYVENPDEFFATHDSFWLVTSLKGKYLPENIDDFTETHRIEGEKHKAVYYEKR